VGADRCLSSHRLDSVDTGSSTPRIDLPEHLTEAQLDGRACLRCGHEAEVGEAMRPVEAWSEQLFECDDVEAYVKRVQRRGSAD
jgi:hypothetical protein